MLHLSGGLQKGKWTLVPRVACMHIVPPPLPLPTQEFEECIGGCSGVDTNTLVHDFHTTISKAELSTALLGDRLADANANCTPKQTQIFVAMFAGGDSFVRCRLEPRLEPTLFEPLAPFFRIERASPLLLHALALGSGLGHDLRDEGVHRCRTFLRLWWLVLAAPAPCP